MKSLKVLFIILSFLFSVISPSLVSGSGCLGSVNDVGIRSYSGDMIGIENVGLEWSCSESTTVTPFTHNSLKITFPNETSIIMNLENYQENNNYSLENYELFIAALNVTNYLNLLGSYQDLVIGMEDNGHEILLFNLTSLSKTVIQIEEREPSYISDFVVSENQIAFKVLFGNDIEFKILDFLTGNIILIPDLFTGQFLYFSPNPSRKSFDFVYDDGEYNIHSLDIPTGVIQQVASIPFSDGRIRGFKIQNGHTFAHYSTRISSDDISVELKIFNTEYAEVNALPFVYNEFMLLNDYIITDDSDHGSNFFGPIDYTWFVFGFVMIVSSRRFRNYRTS